MSALTLIVVAVVWLWVRAQERNLGSSAFTTGYLLLAAILFLALYNVRKKLPFLPLGSSAAWLQWHLYVGIGSVGVFALHAGPRWPNGVAGNGAGGRLFADSRPADWSGCISRGRFPAQLARVGEEVIYERIPALRRQVRQQAGDVVLESVAASGATTLADFYIARLYDFFQRPRGLRYLLRPTTALRRSLMRRDAGSAAIPVGPGAGGVRAAVRAGAAEGRPRFSRGAAEAAQSCGCSCTSG